MKGGEGDREGKTGEGKKGRGGKEVRGPPCVCLNFP